MTITWVVGGTSGIGRACVELLEEVPGRRVIPSGSEVDVRDPDALFTYLAGLTCYEDEQVTDVIYSAGVNKLEWSQIVDPAVVLDLYNVNVVGLINVLQVIPQVRRVVVVGSDAAWREMRTSVAYCASKAALHQAVRVIARERAAEDFAINVVAPGMTEPTEMQEYVDQTVPMIRKWSPDEARKYEKSQIPMKRRANVHEVASVIVSTLLMPTPYLNGAIIPVNGGR
jgi:NAD(P)-dependent dehydrogenase (short-subunit alcohol dehydrogenase family)